MTTLKHRQYPLSTPIHLRATAVPSKYSVRHKLHFSRKPFINQNLTLGNVVISTTVHDRGRGYSNSFTLCRGCTLYPHQPINPPGYHHGSSYTSMRGSDNRSKPPSISLSTGAYPVEFTSPACPGSTSSRVSLRRYGGRTQVSSGSTSSRFT
jgi:hypothetical protein